MPSLRELQTGVLNALLDGAFERAAPLLRGPSGTAARRLAIYENTVFRNVFESLRSTFPLLERLVGGEYFRKTARDFWRQHPSACGDLLPLSAAFPGHLAVVHGADQYAYLADVARFEWLCECALLAAAHDPLDLTRLSNVDPGRYEDLKFAAHPGLRLFESRYPVLHIRETHLSTDGEPPVIDLTRGGDRLALLRAGAELCFFALERGEFAFARALDDGAPFAAASATGSRADAQFDAGAALRRLVSMQAIVDFR